MAEYSSRRWLLIEHFLPWLVLGILLLYTYAGFFQIPYMGFDFNPSTGEVDLIYVEPDADTGLQSGDHLLQVGPVSWNEFRTNSRQPLFESIETGQVLFLEIEREGQMLTIPWEIPGPNPQEILDRLINVWWLAYIFWFAGALTSLLVRPRDARWLLMAASCFLTAIWLIAGNISMWQIWESTILLRVAIWLCTPVYLHLHWVFPRPLSKIPGIFLWSGYLAAAGLAVAECFQVPPRSAFFAGFLLAVGGSILFLVLHFIRQQEQRRIVGLMATAIAMALLPSISLSISGVLTGLPRASGGALLALPILPGAYFYAIYRYQLGALEGRANRVISTYLFVILLGSILIIIVPLANEWLGFPAEAAFIGIVATLITGLTIIYFYPRFERFVDHRLLGIPLPPDHLLESYSALITTSLDIDNLVQLLRDEILPSLLVRQSALLHLKNGEHIIPFYMAGVDVSQLPSQADIISLQARSGKYNPPQTSEGNTHPLSWVRLQFALNVDGKLIGFWLLGRRAPDDLYAQTEISTLQTIANQTAVAMVNIAQARRLRALYHSNIERHEDERANLARDLHDEVLNQLAILSMNVDTELTTGFQESYQTVVDYLRRMIGGLRPAMLNYGLRAALEELVDELTERVEDHMQIFLEVPASDIRYDPRIENHLYRIVQQACENTIRHAEARTIWIYGQLAQEETTLIVEDDGVGLIDQSHLDFDKLLADKHFGLAGMYERAEIIGAELRIDSKPGSGTRLSVIWRTDETESAS
ncbi:ATP-binding protein [Chloroflexota bacterium]